MSIHQLIAGLPTPKPLKLGETALFLDLDGTLAPIAARPQDVRPDPRRTSLLERLEQKLECRLAVVSGRTLADIDRILESRVASVAAVHGLVLRTPNGQVLQAAPHPNLAMAVETFRAFAARNPRMIVEEKAGLSVALHFRLAREEGEAARACAGALAARTGLVLQDGDMVEELRTPGANKGDAVRTFMGQAPFAGATPVFVGDDATDEAGFEAVQALGGFGAIIGAARPTAARFRLAGVEAALAWLEAAQ